MNQPDVSASDFADGVNTPHLRRRLSGEDASVKSRHVVASVIGDVGVTHLSSELSKHCKANVMALSGHRLPAGNAKLPQIITIDLPGLSASSPQRDAELSQHDAYLNSVILSLPTDKYTVIYRTTPPARQEYKQISGQPQQQHLYDMDEQYPSTVHANHFKRDVTAFPRATNGSNLDSNLPLFEKYQFFNSGIFLGFSVSLLLLTILYVALGAVSGLEVSYYAFSKEYNPASQKKQQ